MNIHNKKYLISTAVIALIIGAGIGYAGAGMFASPVASKSTRSGFAGNATGMMRGGTNGGGFLSGTVAAKDSGSITLNTKDGSSHVVLINPATTVSKSATGTENDVVVGGTIIVSGTTNSDGSVSASLIQIRPSTPPTAQ
jgi:hypothetical protein